MISYGVAPDTLYGVLLSPKPGKTKESFLVNFGFEYLSHVVRQQFIGVNSADLSEEHVCMDAQLSLASR